MTGLLVLEIFVIVSAAAIAAMLFVALYRAREPMSQADVASRGYALRRYWFYILLVAAVVVFIVTIPHFPYGSAQTLGKHYTVVAQQYSFSTPPVVPADTPIVFDVTSRDVNHGFAIYDPKGRIVGQVQAMPAYVNHLPFKFHVRGHYTIRCLEYCGIAHAAMQGGFDVR